MNISLAKKIIQKLNSVGVDTFCVCPGGRCAPFVEVLSNSKKIKVFYFNDERSASFFALGQTQAYQKPCAIVTTSGTAVAELLPAVIEGYYSHLPLVLITSDRPLSFRKAASPQTIKNPTSIFKDYTYSSLDIYSEKDIHLKKWQPNKGHLHWNVAFDEPLIDEKDFEIPDFKNITTSIYPDTKTKADKDLKTFFKQSKNPLVLVGELKKEERPIVESFLKNYKGLFYTEALSGLSHLKERLCSGTGILKKLLKDQDIDGVVRLGSVPRDRFWRDLETSNLPVFSLSCLPAHFGLGRKSFSHSLLNNFEELTKHLNDLDNSHSSIKEYDKEQLEKWIKILEEHPQSEDSWIWHLKKSFPDKSNVFLGNSLPIRLWDKVPCTQNFFNITGQQGVNGIDGLVSKFLGTCEPEKNNLAIVGDLSTLYDIGAFWINEQMQAYTLFVINNYGGQIFSSMFENKKFTNSHDLSFEPIAKMWNMNYQILTDVNSMNNVNYSNQKQLVEIKPNPEDSKKTFNKYQSLW